MKIVHIVASLDLRYGGPSRSVLRLSTATAALGHDVELLTSSPTNDSVDNRGRLTIRTWRRGWPGSFCRVPGMAAHLASLSCDVVHHHGLWLRPLHYARTKALRSRIPYVIAPRGMMSQWAWTHHRTKKAVAARCLHPRALEDVSGWQVTSEEESAEIRLLGFSQPVCIAPNGIDQPEAGATEKAKQLWQSQIQPPGASRIALFFSRFHEKKRVLEMIDLWVRLALPGWRLLMVGVPEQYSVSQLREYVAQAGAADRIEVHDGTAQPPPYPVASLFVLPSHSENFGLVIAEAMSHGVPVVVTDATPWSALNRLNLGWCVPWADFGTTLSRAASETGPQLMARGAAAKEWVLREFSWDRSARDLVTFYSSLKPPSS